MKVNSEIFRAYDIRGIVDKDLTEEITFFLGKAIGTFIQLQGRNSVITARDGRISGDLVYSRQFSSILAVGHFESARRGTITLDRNGEIQPKYAW